MAMTSGFVQLMMTDIIIKNINDALNKLIRISDFNQINIGLSSDKIDISHFEYSQVKEYDKFCEDIAKLSINFFIDYDYNKQFSFESRFDSKEYKSRLSNLGFIQKNSRWMSVSKPDIEEVQKNIFVFFLYRLVLQKMTLSDEEQNNQNERRHLELLNNLENNEDITQQCVDITDRLKIDIDRCPFCEERILPRGDKCDACCATVDDMRQQIALIKDRKSETANICCLQEEKDSDNVGTRNEDAGDETDNRNDDDILTNGGPVKTDRNNDDNMTHFSKQSDNINTAPDYAICFLSNKINEDNEEQIEFNECPFCNTIFECNDDCCSLCEASVDDMRKNVAYKINKQKVNKDVIWDNRPKDDNEESDEDESNNSHVGRHKERRKDLPRNVNYDINQKWKCGQCGLLNEYSCGNCGACEDVYGNGYWTCGNCNKENKCDEEECRYCQERNYNIEHMAPNVNANRDIGDNPAQFHRKSDKFNTAPVAKQWDHRKWTCGGCGLLNEYVARTCDACNKVYNDGRWICGECMTENSCAKNECHICCVMNNNVRLDCPRPNIGSNVNYGPLDDVERFNLSQGGKKYDPFSVPLMKKQSENNVNNNLMKLYGAHIPDGDWMCRACNVRHTYMHLSCSACHRGRHSHGLWTCAKCTHVNTCDKDKCGVCDAVNVSLVEQYCQSCNKNKLNNGAERCVQCTKDMHIEWICRFHSFSNVINNGTDYYCQKCGLCRYSLRDDQRKQWFNGGERIVWVCRRCFLSNELTKDRCGGILRFCLQTRGDNILDTNGVIYYD